MIATGAAASCTSKEAGTKVRRNQGSKECEPKKRVYEVRRTRYGGVDEEGELKGVEWIVDCELVRRHFWTDYFGKSRLPTSNWGWRRMGDGMPAERPRQDHAPSSATCLAQLFGSYSSFPKLWLPDLALSLSSNFTC
jgi:hypothetical protein